MGRFDNKVVLVSGGARGQGAAEARLLVAQGASGDRRRAGQSGPDAGCRARGGCVLLGSGLS
jgi:3alpha(or 20beta)-hydroxysteroid dehydrogenase